MFFLLFNLWVVVASSAIAVTIWPALGLMIFGLALEAIADDQKQRAKRADRDAFCYAGLYRKIRHPNYLGEMIFHVGLYCAMVSATDAVYPLLLGAFGTGWVLLLMTRESDPKAWQWVSLSSTLDDGGIAHSRFVTRRFPSTELWLDGHLSARGHKQLAAHIAEHIDR